jgi:hypothetical protein
MATRAGRPLQNTTRTGRKHDEADKSHTLTAQRMRDEFQGMPPKKQRETVELVERCLDDERRDMLAQRRRAPSPLAQLAEQVYGIAVPWATAQVTTAPSSEPRSELTEVVL